MLHRLFYSQAPVPSSSVPQLHRLKFSCGCAGGHGCTAYGPAFQPNLHLYGGIPPGIQDLPPQHFRYLKCVIHKNGLLMVLQHVHLL